MNATNPARTGPTVWAPKINVFGIILHRHDDGTYIGNVARQESITGDTLRGVRGGVDIETVRRVPWDVRVSQDWLRQHQSAWVPA